MSISRRGVASAGLAIAAAGLAFVPTSAEASTSGLVINEVYGGGGNTGASFKNDFIELRNTGSAAVSLGGLSLQYRSATGTSTATNIFTLPAVDLPAGQTYLVGGAAGSGNGADLPAADTTSTLNLSGTGGQIYLATTTAGLDPDTGNVSSATIVDFVGWGGSTTSFETAPAPATTNASSVTRNGAGTDTDNNNADFTVANPPTPVSCTGCASTPPPPPPTATPATIAEIQGTGATSPLVGTTVVTSGIVTAAYPTGGFNGFVIQTDGTGGGSDATPGASDGVYVFVGSSFPAASYPAVGDFVQVTGKVSEFNGLTELNAAADGVVGRNGQPHTGVTPLVTAYPTTNAGREADESELLAPTDRFTVTDNYSTNQYAEIGLATGDRQLQQPTDVADAQDSQAIAAVQADNAARAVTLDDGASLNFFTTGSPNQDVPLPWLTPDNPVRIGSTATLHAPVVLDYRNNAWKFQPQTRVTDDGHAVATFSDTRTPNQAPAPVGGDLRLATFNVLNFFPTSAAEYEAFVNDPNACTPYTDRDTNPISIKTCDPNGPRGAWDATNLARQRSKIVKAINTMDADVVSLEEIENSVEFGKDRDTALAALVDALNAAAGTDRWAFVPSPDPADLPSPAEQDVIRTAFIYNPHTVTPVGASRVLVGSAAFADAREPLAQAFKRRGALDADTFAVVVNHFKSKGSGVDDGTGQGNANPDRVAQAHDLLAFADEFASDRGTTKVFLAGDFNSYTMEDPIQVLEGGGYTNLASDDPKDTTYEYGGMAGSLDHVLANADALAMVRGVDVWQINAEESVGFEYSRYNYNATLLYQDNQFRASDHNPEVVGLAAPYSQESSVTDSTVTPASVEVDHGSVTIDTTVTAASGTPTGTVEYWQGDTRVGESTLDADGHTTFGYGPFDSTGSRTVEVRYLGDTVTEPSSDTVTFDVTRVASTTTATASPATVKVKKGTATVTASVATADGPATGTVEVLVDGTLVDTVTLSHGTATATVGPFATVGAHVVEVRYRGTDTVAPSSGSVTVTAVKGNPKE